MSTPLGLALPILALASVASAQYQVTAFSSALWRTSDAVLGVAGLEIEGFETHQLNPRLKVSVNTGIGLLNPTNVLPNLMTAGPDPFGTAFSTAAWDGTRILINSPTNQAQPYNEPQAWGNLTLLFAGGTDVVGFSLHQMQHPTLNRVIINGNDVGSVAQFLALPASNTRNGYAVVRVVDPENPDNLIRSFTIAVPTGDKFAIDHLAIGLIPSPGVLTLLGLAGLVVARRRS